jgi:hypothetical protein
MAQLRKIINRPRPALTHMPTSAPVERPDVVAGSVGAEVVEVSPTVGVQSDVAVRELDVQDTSSGDLYATHQASAIGPLKHSRHHATWS